ncbi:MAG TPA: DUF1217 domain-containing protein [Methylocella sp.]|nr:DUF1217 domain-containing protein [Methylocella sp.]
MTTLSTYLAITNNMSRWLSATAANPAVSTATEYFEENIGNIKSANQLVGNTRLFDYAMTAFGLGDMTYAQGMMKQVLAQGVTSSNALANTLNNQNILAFAKAFDFADNGSATTSSQSLVSNVVNRYLQNSLDDSEAQQDPGVQLALYFEQNAPNLTSEYGILADKNLLTVVQTALGLSPYTSEEPIDTQASQLSSLINITDFQNPAKLQNFIERFAAMYDMNNAGSSTSPALSQVASLFGGGGVGISSSLLEQAANINFSNL